MHLRLDRIEFYDHSTIGKLYVDGKFECFTLEDRDRLREGLPKVYGETAIPVGTYRITLEYSPRFKVILPRLHNVPQFEGVLIHSGNRAEHTDGCILSGTREFDSYIEESRAALKKLIAKLTTADKIDITIAHAS